MKTPIFIVVVLFMTDYSCLSAQSKNDRTISAKDSTTINNNPLNKVVAAYLDLKNALTNDDETNVSKSGKTLFKAIDNVPMGKLTTAQHNIWMNYYDRLSYDARHIKESSDIDHQREHFVSLSKNMYIVLMGFKTNTATLYYQFCPMANDGKGAYWLSESGKISNPYLGSKMPTCGSTKDTIKAARK